MTKGFEFELLDGTILQVVPKAGMTACAISHGETKIDIDLEKNSFRMVAPAGKNVATVQSVVRFEPKEITVKNSVPGQLSPADAPHIMRSCMSCNGKWCCVTNGCGNCGCGWFCD